MATKSLRNILETSYPPQTSTPIMTRDELKDLKQKLRTTTTAGFNNNKHDLEIIMLVCSYWMRYTNAIVNDIIDLIVKFAAFQLAYITDQVSTMSMFPEPIAFDQINELYDGKILDVRDNVGKYCKAKVLARGDQTITIHYEGWSDTYDETIETFSDTAKARLFKSETVSKRKRHRLLWLKVGDYVDVNPLKHPGWKYGEITSIDKKSGQVEISYEIDDTAHYHWAHLDDESEIAQFLTKSNPLNATQIATEEAVTNSHKRKLENVEYEFTFDDISSNSQSHTQPQPRKKRKLNVTAGNTITNPWTEIMNSNEKHIPQWVKCTVCNKWRLLLVVTANISVWKAPVHFTCSMSNTKYNNCSMPQQTDSEMSAMYSSVQLQGLTVQRNIIMERSKKPQTSKTEIKNKIKGKNVEIIELKDEKLELINKNKLLIKDKRNLKREREEFKRLNNKLVDMNSGLSEENERLKLEVDKMKDKRSFEMKLGRVSSMNLEELDELEMEFNDSINVIKDARDRLLESKLYCIVCLKNAKNVFVNGCGHLDMCSECENNMISKICPRCQIPYQTVTKINI
eukprot:540660_1